MQGATLVALPSMLMLSRQKEEEEEVVEEEDGDPTCSPNADDQRDIWN
jgi:hypothetical protein